MTPEHPMTAWWDRQAAPHHINLTPPAGAPWDDLRAEEEIA